MMQKRKMTFYLLQVYHSIQKERKALKPPIHKKNPTRYYLGESYPDVYLSMREAQCVVLYLENSSNLEIANLLNLSTRTVEFYFDNVKAKLNIKNKKQIVERIKNTDFITSVASIKSELPAQ